MDEKKIISLADVPQVAIQLREKLTHSRIVTLTGPLGSGKTTLVQEVLRQLGVTGPIQSPTYTYVSIYHLPSKKILYHFDLYRIESANAFVALGFDEYLQQTNSYCFIEWPAIIEQLIKEPVIAVSLDYAPDNRRELVIDE